MSSYLVRLRERNQLTLPAEIAEELAVEPGSLLELVLERDGDGVHVELRHAQVVRANTHQAKLSEQRARKDIQEGRFSTFANPDELALDMKQTRDAEAKQLRAQVEDLQEQMQGILLNMRRVGAATGIVFTDVPCNLSTKA
jgi:bifunctional DNA-binding transcriptional regulator/antitoxin component of YhaV-PrlF toxin-antitoxin module